MCLPNMKKTYFLPKLHNTHIYFCMLLIFLPKTRTNIQKEAMNPLLIPYYKDKHSHSFTHLATTKLMFFMNNKYCGGSWYWHLFKLFSTLPTTTNELVPSQWYYVPKWLSLKEFLYLFFIFFGLLELQVFAKLLPLRRHQHL